MLFVPKPAPLVFRGKPRGEGKLGVKMKQGIVLCCSSQRSAAQPAPGCGCCVLDTLCSAGVEQAHLEGCKTRLWGDTEPTKRCL